MSNPTHDVPPSPIPDIRRKHYEVLRLRERFRDRYWTERDPICDDRLLWRAQTFRHMVHLLPGQSILEIGSGAGLFTQQLVKVSRQENPITSIVFQRDTPPLTKPGRQIEVIRMEDPFQHLQKRQFDFIIAMDLMDEKNCGWFLQQVYQLLKPGGQVIFYESNPWNPVLKIRRAIGSLLGGPDPRRLLHRSKLYELISELGFIRVFALYNDFVYAPLTPTLIWPLRNLSILLENTKFIQKLAGSLLIHAQKPPRSVQRPQRSLVEHDSLRNAVSVVVPCYNEEMNIEILIAQLMRYYGGYIYEIIPVDDNSTDQTAAILRRLSGGDPRIRPVFRQPPNGVGRAIRAGLEAARGEYILSMDCDFQHLLPELRDLFDAAAAGHDVVVGSRFSRHSVLLNYPIGKIVANRGFHLLAKILFRRGFRDLTNNLKLMRREVVRQIEFTQPGFAINAETGLRPLLAGFSVCEVPISWIDRTPDMGASSFRVLRVGGGYLQVLWDCWRQKLGIRRP